MDEHPIQAIVNVTILFRKRTVPAAHDRFAHLLAGVAPDDAAPSPIIDPR
jgi:hypothetical protein